MALFALFALLYWLNRRFRLVSRLRRMILSFVAFCRRLARKLRAWIKAKLGLRQFHVRGQAKAMMEVLWACLTYNIQQWTRLRWLPQLKTVEA